MDSRDRSDCPELPQADLESVGRSDVVARAENSPEGSMLNCNRSTEVSAGHGEGLPLPDDRKGEDSGGGRLGERRGGKSANSYPHPEQRGTYAADTAIIALPEIPAVISAGGRFHEIQDRGGDVAQGAAGPEGAAAIERHEGQPDSSCARY